MQKILLHIRMAGSVDQPESVRASDLAQFLIETERAIGETAEAQGAELPDLAFLSLVGIERGHSSRLIFAVDPLVNGAPAAITKAVSSGRLNKLPVPAQNALVEISKQAVKRGWEIEFEPAPELKMKRAVISAEHPVHPPAPTVVTGGSVIYGVCYRVGGEDQPTAAIRLIEGGKLTIDVSISIAKALAKRLYEEVGIEGDAAWNSDSWEMISFKASRLLDYDPVDIQTALHNLANVDADRWKGVDADKHVRELRSSQG